MTSSRSNGLFAAVGVGVGLGLGLISARLAASTPGGGATAADIEAELRHLLVDGRKAGVTFADFPYYLSEETRLALTSAAFPYLTQSVLPKHIKVLDASRRTILLRGPSEQCLLSLAKAVAHQFNASLLALDIFEFMRQINDKYGGSGPSTAPVEAPIRSTSESTLDRVCGFVQSLNIFRKKADPTGSLEHEKGTMDLKTSFPLKSVRSIFITIIPDAKNNYSESTGDDEIVLPFWNLDEKILIQSLYKVIVSASECNPVILYIRDVNVILDSSKRAYSMFQKMLNKLSGRVFIIGSHIVDADQDSDYVDEGATDLFPCILETKPPKDKANLEKWKTQVEDDKEKSHIELFTNQIAGFLSANNLECGDLSSISREDLLEILCNLDDILAPAVSYHLMNNKDHEYKSGRLVLSSTSLTHGLTIFQESNLGKDAVATKDSKVAKDNEYEQRIRESVIPASETGVTFDDIGALDDIKESVQELVRLPLQRPELFDGGLLKPCRGILLFGPPGTGKTMLAKAIANEAGASFMNISMSTITSKWYGESEKSIRALFSLAAKIAPTIIFVDEVDSMLGTREISNENEVSRRVKNEFMTHWDGLLSKSNERILVLAATNRPFDLDDAIIRRFEHRMMVGLPTLESRELIFKKLLSKVKVEGIDFNELAKMTEGYSGSDLKNLCVSAAYRPVRELLKKEEEMKKDTKKKEEKGKNVQPKNQGSGKEKPASSKGKKVISKEGDKEETEETVGLRPLTMEDLKQAKDEVPASFDGNGAIMNEIKQWNELYGKGGTRKKKPLTYFI